MNGIRCENLEHLSFGDESFDLHLTQDVFEHLFDPAALSVKLPERFAPVERISLLLRSSEKTSRLDFVQSLAPDGSVIPFFEP